MLECVFVRRHKANESLRPGKPRSHADIFGIEGSFRRLDMQYTSSIIINTIYICTSVHQLQMLHDE